ncbi:serine/threonine protein kinase [Archangium lansingense]|uniref:serine/threonine protein kinase n=1 Tax=Archangium lansingense TaxID=2995310 RepID=UPI003B7AB1FE
MKLAPPVENASFPFPARGDKVEGYEIVAPLGSGGHGLVYKVVREGRFFALKLLRARSLDARGQREINILRHLLHRNVVRLHTWGRWPHAVHGHLFFVMDFVAGRTLEEWALDDNPCARCVARVLLEVVRALADIHARGVLHRDLKRENILLRTSDGVPMLVDFGIGWLAGEPTLTGETLPPGTPEYRSPEALRFEREHADGQARYTPDAGDELWALGVILYWLLTDVLPFGQRYVGALNERILTVRPKAPREVNPRVPHVLSELCMHMLEKERRARFATCVELAGALEAALAGADESWVLPLVDVEAPELAPTEDVPGMAPSDADAKAAQRWTAGPLRRGQKTRRGPAPARHECGPAVVEPPVPVTVPAQEVAGSAPVGEVPDAAVMAGPAPRASPPPVAEAAAPPATHAHGAQGASLAPPSPVRRAHARSLLATGMTPIHAAIVALAVVLLGVGVLAGAWAVKGRTAAAPAPALPEEPLPPGRLASNPTLHAYLVREVAASRGPSEAGGGAATVLDPPPASTFATMLRENDARLKSEEKPTPRPQRKALPCVPTRQETCVVGFCIVLLTSCTSTPQVVRPPPRPADCPPEALKAMKELGIAIGDTAGVAFPVEGGVKRVTVRESTPVRTVDRLGQLDPVHLTGRLYLGPERVYGCFTQARTHTGKTYPVCMELIHRDEETLGAERYDVGGPADAAVVLSTQYIRAVDRFK